MVDMRAELEFESQLERTWWELSNQLDNTLSESHRSVLFAISLATAFLTFVSATVTVLNAPQLWWVAAGLVVVGVLILGFTRELAAGELDAYLT